MKKLRTLIYLFFSLLSGLSIAQEADEKLIVSTSFEQKLRHFYPDYKFSVTVAFKKPQKLELSLFGEVQMEKKDEITRRLESVKVLTDADISSKEVEQILGISNITVELKKFDVKKSGSAQVSGTSLKSIDDPSINSPTIYIFLGFILVALSLVAATVILKNSIVKGSSQIALAANQGQGEAPRTIEKETAIRKAVGDQKHAPKPYQLKALFSDLYWSGEDAKAAALVRQYQELELYKELSFGAEYVNYLTLIAPEAFDFFDDPYYLAPVEEFLEMSVPDMAPEYFLNCSRFRLAQGPLSSYQLAKLRMKTERSGVQITAQRSKHRRLVKPYVFNFATVADEREFLTSDLPDIVKFQAPSLYLLTKLSDEAFQTIISNVTINELIQCWIGPEELLQEIMERLPDRKRSILQDMLAQRRGDSISSREGAVFQRLLKSARDLLRPAAEDKKNLELVG